MILLLKMHTILKQPTKYDNDTVMFMLNWLSLLYDPGFATGWIVWLGLSIVGLCLSITCAIGMRGAHVVSLDMLLSYFWGVIVFIGPLVIGRVFHHFSIVLYCLGKV